MRNVKITFLSDQKAQDSHDSTHQIAYGTLEKTEKGYILKYIEPDNEMGKSKSTIHIFNEKHILLKREGIYESTFPIEEGKEKKALYKTPAGTMDMTISAKKVNAQINALGGKIHLNYDLYNAEEYVSEITLILEIKFID